MGHRCCGRQKVKRGLWSPEEDDKLTRYITAHGHSCWSSIPKLAGLQRCGKSCRLRWINYLRPDLKRGSFTVQEEQIIIDVHRILGNRWAQIAKHLPGRTDNEVKNFWNSCIKKKLISQGLDPKTHNLLSSHKRSSQIKHKATLSWPASHDQHHSSTFSITDGSQVTRVSSTIEAVQAPLPSSEEQSLSVWTMSGTTSTNSTMTSIPRTTTSYDNNGDTLPIPLTLSSFPLINPCGFGLVEENCTWATNFETFEDIHDPRTVQELQLPSEPQKVQKVKTCEELIELDYKEMDSSFGSSTTTFNLDSFVESTLISGAMCSHDTISPMDIDLAWNF